MLKKVKPEMLVQLLRLLQCVKFKKNKAYEKGKKSHTTGSKRIDKSPA
jgi:hypothetical protein